MPNKQENLIGRKFDRVTVEAEAEPRITEREGKSPTKVRRWKAKCTCGKYRTFTTSQLLSANRGMRACTDCVNTIVAERRSKRSDWQFKNR